MRCRAMEMTKTGKMKTKLNGRRRIKTVGKFITMTLQTEPPIYIIACPTSRTRMMILMTLLTRVIKNINLHTIAKHFSHHTDPQAQKHLPAIFYIMCIAIFRSFAHIRWLTRIITKLSLLCHRLQCFVLSRHAVSTLPKYFSAANLLHDARYLYFGLRAWQTLHRLFHDMSKRPLKRVRTNPSLPNSSLFSMLCKKCRSQLPKFCPCFPAFCSTHPQAWLVSLLKLFLHWPWTYAAGSALLLNCPTKLERFRCEPAIWRQTLIAPSLKILRHYLMCYPRSSAIHQLPLLTRL